VAASPTPIPAATEQQHHDNNNQDQFHRNSPLTPTGIRWPPKKQRRLKAIVPDKPVSVAQLASCDVSNFARASDIGALAPNRSRESLLRRLSWVETHRSDMADARRSWSDDCKGRQDRF
jgi:hypothetical protein